MDEDSHGTSPEERSPLAVPARHVPVMRAEAIASLQPIEGGLFVDATYGLGGYAAGLLAEGARHVIGIDADPDRVTEAYARDVPQAQGRLTVVHANFRNLRAVIPPLLAALPPGGRHVGQDGIHGIEGADGVDGVDGIVFDLGVSSVQLDETARGFSHRFDATPDMRFDTTSSTTSLPSSSSSSSSSSRPSTATAITASSLLATIDQRELTRLLSHYGEERNAHRIARSIIAAREAAMVSATKDTVTPPTAHPAHHPSPVHSTRALALAIERVVPERFRVQTLSRCFQAIRIAVNEEMDALSDGLAATAPLMRPGGRLVVISFHSLEDRLVKRFMRQGTAQNSRYMPESTDKPLFEEQRKKPIAVSAAEEHQNKRARSAKLRRAVRTTAPCPLSSSSSPSSHPPSGQEPSVPSVPL